MAAATKAMRQLKCLRSCPDKDAGWGNLLSKIRGWMSAVSSLYGAWGEAPEVNAVFIGKKSSG